MSDQGDNCTQKNYSLNLLKSIMDSGSTQPNCVLITLMEFFESMQTPCVVTTQLNEVESMWNSNVQPTQFIDFAST